MERLQPFKAVLRAEEFEHICAEESERRAISLSTSQLQYQLYIYSCGSSFVIAKLSNSLGV